jgi:hypothetical protein
VPNVARVWNSLGGGRDSFEADRSAARQLVAVSPVMAQVGPASRAFRRRVVTYLAEAGIRQFLDVGTGLPAEHSAHSVAQAVDPACRVVYVDNDPVVVAHARARLRSRVGSGVTSYLEADARDTTAVLAGAGKTLDLTQPVGLLMTMVLNFVEDAGGALSRLVTALPAGSHLVMAHPSRDERVTAATRWWNQVGTVPSFLRDQAEVERWLWDLELLEPGIVEVHRWRPEPGDPDYPEGLPLLGAVARKPYRQPGR